MNTLLANCICQTQIDFEREECLLQLPGLTHCLHLVPGKDSQGTHCHHLVICWLEKCPILALSSYVQQNYCPKNCYWHSWNVDFQTMEGLQSKPKHVIYIQMIPKTTNHLH